MNAPEHKVVTLKPASEPRGVGARLPFVDGVEKVTGTARCSASSCAAPMPTPNCSKSISAQPWDCPACAR